MFPVLIGGLPGSSLGAPGGGGGIDYQAKVLGYSPITYWPLNETEGTTADNAEGTAARDGSYNGSMALADTTGPDGDVCPLWDATNDYVNIYSVSLNSVFDPTLGSIHIWFKVSAGSVWTDGTQRAFIGIRADANNYVLLAKSGATSNQISFNYRAGGTLEQGLHTISDTGWNAMGITWNKTGNNCEFYINGTQLTGTGGLGTWSGSLSSTVCDIGAISTTPTQVWDGWIAHAAVFDTELSPTDMGDLAVAA